jgi:6-phosphofructokinase 1
MREILKGNAVVGQSGGPTAVINQSLVGVIEALAGQDAIGRLLGAHHGVRGIVGEKFIDLKDLDPDLLERVAATPSSALGSTRDKPDEEYCHKIFESFRKNDVRYFFYIGGNDSADAARIVSEKAAAENYDLRVFHIPKTIDNDLRVTDHCPGYGSAARFVACAMMGDDRDNASLPGVKIDVVMGRHAGWLTAASVLGRRDEADGPHLVYVPESPLTEEKFVDDVAEVYGRLGRCLVAVSEGIEGPDHMSWGERLALEAEKSGIGHVERDGHGNVQLSGSGALGDALARIVKEKVSAKLGGKKLRIRADTFGYLQRSFPGFASPTDAREARAVGRKAVQYALAGKPSGSVAIKRKAGPAYGVSYFRAELKDVARETKPLVPEFLAPTGRGINEEAFRAYALPLVGKLPVSGKLF